MLTKSELGEYHLLWKDLKYKYNFPKVDERQDYIDYEKIKSRLDELKQKSQNVLECCETIKQIPIIKFNSIRWILDVQIKPEDSLEYYRKHDFEALPSPIACPYCGTKLPKMESFEINVPVGNLDDEYYCRNCDGSYECICLPPGTNYKPLISRS